MFFSRIGVSRCYIFFSSAVFCQFFPAPWFFQNVFSRIAVFFPEPSAYIFFPECFFQNCILPILLCTLRSSVFSRMFFSRIAFCQFFSCAFCLPFLPGCFFPNCNFAIFFCALCLSVFSRMFFPELYFANFFLHPLMPVFSGRFFPELVFPCALYFSRIVFCHFFLRPFSFFHYVFSQKDAPKIPEPKQSTKKTLKNPYQNISEERSLPKNFRRDISTKRISEDNSIPKTNRETVLPKNLRCNIFCQKN